MAGRPKKAPRDGHLGDPLNIVRAVLWVLVPATGLGLVLFLLVGSQLLLFLCVLAWAVFVMTVLLQRIVIESAGRAVGHILMPSGSSTPAGKPLSHIEAMEARGDLTKAAEAYKAEIASDAGDVTSCERLALLALRRLKDYELALWAYREAERRAEAPARKFGFGLLAAGILRDQIRDLPRAVVELRRLVQQYPNAPRLAALRAEIEELKVAIIEQRNA